MDEDTIQDAKRFRYLRDLQWEKYQKDLGKEIDYLMEHDWDKSKQLSLPLWD